jgi:hypothetical protein
MNEERKIKMEDEKWKMEAADGRLEEHRMVVGIRRWSFFVSILQTE